MKMSRLSLLLVGFASISAGCQPEEPSQVSTAGLVVHEAALTDPVGSWTRNSPLLLSHSGPMATLLRGTGEVLVTGAGTAEVYNPYTDRWQPTGSPNTARTQFTATELPSGQVLIAGGEGGISSAELYDPKSGTWSTTSPMANTRRGHVAVQLHSGKVLVVGGETAADIRGPLDPLSEVYDPETATWTPVESFVYPRIRASAVVLDSGQVMLTGGVYWFGSNAWKTASEVNFYDPTTNKWRTAGSLSKARHGHFSIKLYSGNVMIVGGFEGGNTVEMYDPYNNRWFMGPSVPLEESVPIVAAMMLYSGEVLVTNILGQSALYDPLTNAWLPAASVSSSVGTEPSTTLLHTGQVLLIGGSRVERFTR